MLSLVLAAAIMSFPSSDLDTYDVTWDSPSENAAGSMPIGNGETVLNVWVEKKTGDLLFYIARSDSYSEISRLLKLGRVRVHFDPPVLNAGAFQQQLHLHDGCIDIRSSAAALKVFVDSDSDNVFVSGQSAVPISAIAAVEDWRTEKHTISKEEMVSAWSVHDAPFPLIEAPDVFPPGDPDSVVWYHRNETSVVPKLWENQSLTGLKRLYDPILHRTFGCSLTGKDCKRIVGNAVITKLGVRSFEFKLTNACRQTDSVGDWLKTLKTESEKADRAKAEVRTKNWWNQFWFRSWVFADGDRKDHSVPKNEYRLSRGADPRGENLFPGDIADWRYFPAFFPEDKLAAALGSRGETAEANVDFSNGFTLAARIRPHELRPGRIFDKGTPGKNDGLLFDTHPGNALRLIVGDSVLVAPNVLQKDVWSDVIASYDAATGEASIYLDGRRVAHQDPETDSSITRGYVLQRYVQACQGRGEFPIKFNGGAYTVEPTAMGKPLNPDWRAWGDAHWFQNIRHMYHPMLAEGDTEMMEPFFKLYENARPLAESRSKFYHGAEGAYFPETMTVFGTYSGGDYGWDRTGHKPSEVLCPWWDDAWNQGLELVGLMLDRWDYTRDEAFLKARVLPMAESVLRYFDTRFHKDADGRIVLDPTQVVETYWDGVVNDMPSTAGLISITNRLAALPQTMVSDQQRSFFERMKRSCPELPLQEADGKRELAPAQKYEPKRSNVENGELYAVWPFRVVSLAHPELLAEAKQAYQDRKDHLDVGWGYDGNVAALLGLTDEAARILQVKSRNSNPAYRWPATWGPNFDWLPDQNHGGNLLNTMNLMLLQAEPLEAGGAIRILPAWPKKWNVSFKLRAPGRTVVTCIARDGKITDLVVDPPERKKDVIWPDGWEKP